MRRMRLRTAMTAIAALAILLGAGVGLDRRARRLEALSLLYGREANRLDDLWVEAAPVSAGEPDLLMERVHWHDSVANAYRLASAQPWLPLDPVPRNIICRCGYHAARSSRTTE